MFGRRSDSLAEHLEAMRGELQSQCDRSRRAVAASVALLAHVREGRCQLLLPLVQRRPGMR